MINECPCINWARKDVLAPLINGHHENCLYSNPNFLKKKKVKMNLETVQDLRKVRNSYQVKINELKTGITEAEPIKDKLLRFAKITSLTFKQKTVDSIIEGMLDGDK